MSAIVIQFPLAKSTSFLTNGLRIAVEQVAAATIRERYAEADAMLRAAAEFRRDELEYPLLRLLDDGYTRHAERSGQ